MPFLFVELGLRALNVGNPTQAQADPLVGFSQLHPLFELNDAQDVLQTARSRQLFFGHQEFPAKKSPKTFRVFCLGGSTVRGHPFETHTAFSHWMQMEMAARDPSRRFEVINCGGLSYASYRLRILLEEILTYEPDLIVIATGHNEFLEDRTYQDIKSRSDARSYLEDRLQTLRTVSVVRQAFRQNAAHPGTSQGKTVLGDKVVTRLDQANGYESYHFDESWRSGVKYHFAQSVRAMVATCQEAKVPLLLVRLGANLRSTPPFKSENSTSLPAEKLRTWKAAFDRGSELDGSDTLEAINAYLDAAQMDDRHALLSYRLARCYDRLKQYELAKRYYLKAKNDDVCPLRMLDDMAADLVQIAQETKTPLVDADALFQEISDQGIPGDDWYMDHVHPSIHGYQLIAREIVATIGSQAYGTGFSTDWSPAERQQAYEDYLTGLGETYWAQGRERVAWLEGWAQRQRLFFETLPVSSDEFFRQAIRRFNFGLEAEAIADFKKAVALEEKIAARISDFALQVELEGRRVQASRLRTALAIP